MLDSTAAEVSLYADYSRLASGLRAAAQLVRDFGSGSSKAMSRINLAPDAVPKGQNWLANKLGQAASQGAVALAGRGVEMLVEQGKNVFEFNDELVRFGISTRIAGQGLDDIGTAARRTSDAIGIDAREVLAAGRAYVDLAGAQNFSVKKMDLLARAAQATGSKTTDLAGMMYQLTRSMKVTDDQMEDTIGGLINQAKDGAVEAKQMAAEFSAILPLFARFKDATGREGAVQAGAMFQVIRDGFNSASEAGTGVQRVFAGIRSYASRFEEKGVRIWDIDKDGYKHARRFSDIFTDISKSVLVKDPGLLKKAFGRTEGWRSMELMMENIPRLRELEASGRRNGVIMQDLGTYTTSAAGRMAISFEKLKNKVAEAFTPERIDKFVSVVEKGMDVLGKLVKATDYLDADKSPARGKFRAIGADVTTPDDPRSYAVGVARARVIAESQIGQADIAKLSDSERKEMINRHTIDRAKAEMAGNHEERGFADEAIRQLQFLRQENDPWAGGKMGPRQSMTDKPVIETLIQIRDVMRGVQAYQADYLSRPPWINDFARAVREAARDQKITTTVAIDGNPVARAASNATDRRRRP